MLPVFNQNTATYPHVLTQLSQRTYNRVKNNCIHVDSLKISHNKNIVIHYNCVSHGNNINYYKQTDDSNVKTVNLHETKGNYIIIAVNKSEIINNKKLSSVIIIQHGLRTGWKEEMDNKHKQSEYVILMVTKFKKRVSIKILLGTENTLKL